MTPRWPAAVAKQLLRHAGVEVRHTPPPQRSPAVDAFRQFGAFTTDDGRTLPLYDGYRDSIKNRWRLEHWPAHALMSVGDRPELTPAARECLGALRGGRTLPASLDDLAAVVTELAAALPDALVVSTVICPVTHRPIVAARVSDARARALADAYRGIAAAALRHAAGRTATSAVHALEVGCGIGYAVAAMTELGVARSAGVDSAGEEDYRSVCERAAVLARLPPADRWRVSEGDVAALPFDAGEFNLIYSASVLEHVHDLDAAFLEMARVLAPGGVMWHSVDPYFSPSGGHSSCTLDFPWGHARLSAGEFARYVTEFRPFEAAHATRMYATLFNTPRVSLHQIEQSIAKAGLTIVSWQEQVRADHLPPPAIWSEIARLYPAVGPRELAVSGVDIVAAKER